MRLARFEKVNRYGSPTDDEAVETGDAAKGTWTDIVVDCIAMQWDGIQVGPVRMVHRVQHFTGKKKITDLELYPIQFRNKNEEICKTLTTRGRRVINCFGHKKYNGLTVKSTSLQMPPTYPRQPGMPPPPPNYRERNPDSVREIDSDVYIDFNAFFKLIPLRFERLRRVIPSREEVAEQFGPQKLTEYYTGDHEVDEIRSDKFLSNNRHLTFPQKPEELEGLSQDYLMLLPHAVPGYDFRQREWARLDVDKVEDIDKSEQARTRGWEDLVINKGYSQLLLSLVDNHTSAVDHRRRRNAAGHRVSTAQIDLIKGKGRGLIILLYGPPGTGKTSTAEAVAAYSGKPLYAITCGDIGTVPPAVEDNLRMHTQRAEEWGCVLLLDEADVFLARRTWNDMNRNALVSIFLRHLEYYSGILFLTTNIVGIIDEAFKSRIHVALRYNTINLDSTQSIWDNMLNRIIKDNEYADVKISFNRDALLDFARRHYEQHEPDETTWNARQIRNAFSTAIAMGQFDRIERIRKEGLTPDEAAQSSKKSFMTIKLTSRNFCKIAETAADFEEYINTVRGPDRDNALANQQRNDYFETPAKQPPRKLYRQQAEEDQVVRRRGHATPPTSSRPPKGKRIARRPVYMDEEEDDDDDDDDDNDDDRKHGVGTARHKELKFSEHDDSEEE
ncbi:hypothetical protein F5Y19DRAFT_421017 [Xylariaceae sp. FL1651]|nr:hypothetical protein F5Y19DRAFT_421017 [Xylariaceae sp. FL1651]